MNKNYLEINNVDFQVGGKVKVKNLSLKIQNKGQIICLLGPSGIGKTTILRSEYLFLFYGNSSLLAQ